MPGTNIAPLDMGGLIQAAQGSPMEQLMRGLTVGMQGFMQTQQLGQQMEEARIRRQEEQAKLQDYQRSIAQSQWDQIGKQVIANPKFGTSPAVVKRLQALGAQLGYEVPTNADGSIDPSPWKPTFADMMKDSQWAQAWNAAGSDTKKAMATEVSGVTPEMIAAGPTLTAHEQVAIGKLKLDDTNITDMVRNRDLKTQYEKALATGRVDLMTAQAKEAYQRGNAALITANAAQQRANQEITIATIRAKASLARAGQAGSKAGEQLAKSAVGEAQRAVDSAEREYANYDAQVKTATIANGADDPTVQQLTAKRDGFKAQIDTAKQQLNDARSVLATQPGVTGEVQSASGKKVTNVQNTSKVPPPPGSPSSTGPKGTVWFYNGAWHDANGNIVQ